MKKTGKRLLSMVLTAVMVLSCFGGLKATKVKAAIEDNDAGLEAYNKIDRMSNTPPEQYKKDVDPFGYGEDVPFTLLRHSRLAIYDSFYGGKYNNSFSSYDLQMTIDHNTGLVKGRLDGKEVSPVNRTYNLSTEQSKLNYVQMKAFSPTKSGKKDHIAIIGLLAKGENNIQLMLYVTNKDGSVKSNYLELGNMSWVANNLTGQLHYVEKQFFSITAGDYNGDQKDTLVVWGCYNGSDYGLNEIEVEDSGNKIVISKKDSKKHNKNLLHNIYNSKMSKLDLSFSGNHLGAVLDSGDVNGDGIDDLVALSYTFAILDDNRGKNQPIDMYRPYVAVAYGDENLGNNDVSSKRNKEMGVWTEKNGSTYKTCALPGLTLGNIIREDEKGKIDSKKEIIVVGMYNELVKTSSGKPSTEPYEYLTNNMRDNAHFYFAVYDESLNLKAEQITDANGWSKEYAFMMLNSNAYLSETMCIGPQTGVQCVNINGSNNAPYIFVNGSFYSYEKNESGVYSMNNKYTMSYFKRNSGRTRFVWSIAAGNFNGNTEGKEQIVVTTGELVAGTEIAFAMGMAYGNNYSNGIVTDFSETRFMSPDFPSVYYDEDITRFYPFVYYKFGDTVFENYALNYTVCAVDNEDDGVVVRYKGKELLYSDPEVMAVLQAAPYFEDVFDYITDTNNLTYHISESMEYGVTASESNAVGVAICAELETSPLNISVKAGEELEWSAEFTNSMETSTTYEWSANWEDTVVVKRVPIIVYEYEIMQDGEFKGNGMSLSFATTPAYETLTLTKYNAFVDYYNEKVKASDNYNKENDAAKKEKMLLKKITDQYLGNEGNPYKYLNSGISVPGYTLIQTTPQTFGYGSNSSGFSWEHNKTEEYSESHAAGFSLEASVMVGFSIGGNGVKAGVEASYQKMYEEAISHSKSYGSGIEATVFNIDSNAARKDRENVIGVEDAVSKYSFKWQIARWNSGLKDSRGNMVPIYGFKISDIIEPGRRVEDVEGKFEFDNNGEGIITPSAIKLTWEDPGTDINKTSRFKIYKRSLNGKSREYVGDVPVTAGTSEYSFNYDFETNNVNLEGEQEFVFTISAVNEDSMEGMESEKVVVSLTGINKSIAAIEKSGSIDNMDIYTILYTDGTSSQFTITNGKDGKDGADGKDGKDGKDGENGKDGVSSGYIGRDGKDGKDGVDGKDGKDGEDGKDGVGISGIMIADNGDLIFTLTDDTKINAGNLIKLLSEYQKSENFTEKAAALRSYSSTSSYISVRWAAIDDADGYEVRYSTSKDMKNAKTVSVNGASSTKRKISSLSANKRYYIQVRGYMNLGSDKVYTKWSDKGTAKTKK